VDAPAVRIRDAGVADAEAIYALWEAAYGDALRSVAEDVATLLAHGPAARLLVAERDGEMLGTLIATFDGWRGNMYRMAVHPKARRRGVATKLVEAAHDWLRNLGCSRVTALVEGDHDWATGFWESAGYEHDVSMRRYHFTIE
jgi:GNAT superfamily N-acetyltransferase